MIAGACAIRDFPLAPRCISALAARVDHLSLWIDRDADRSIVAQCITAACAVPLDMIRSREKWTRSNWREALIRSLDDIRPDYVLAPDSDEMFAEGFDADFEAFRESGRDLMMLGAAMETEDNREVPLYPKARHCKAFRWRAGLTFQPYRGFARPTLPGGELTEYRAATLIRHLCFWTRAMEQAKQLHR